MTDIPVDTPIGKTVAEIEDKSSNLLDEPGVPTWAEPTILALCVALRKAHEKLSQRTLTVLEIRKELLEAREKILELEHKLWLLSPEGREWYPEAP